MSEPKVMHRVKSSELKEALNFAAKRDVRYYLAGVQIRKSKNGQTVIDATNGHYLYSAVSGDGESSGDPIILSREFIESVPQSVFVCICDDGSAYTEIDVSAKRTLSQFIPQSYKSGVLIDGKYPDVSRVIPKFEDLSVGMNIEQISSEYLIKGLKIFDKRGKGFSGVRCLSDKDRVLITNHNFSKIFIIMRQKSDDINGYPEWIEVSK